MDDVKAGALWGPFVEWAVDGPEVSGNPYDVVGQARFVHAESGREVTTGMFYSGEQTWKFRFTGTELGTWRFQTSSEAAELDGLTGAVQVAPGSEPARGFVTSRENRWAWSGTGAVFVPQLVMYDAPPEFLDHPEKVERDIQTFLVDHGFNGFHVPVFCRWWDIYQEQYEGIASEDPNPDPRTFEALELLIQKVHASGGMIHLWMWGDNDANHHQTPMKAGWGGKNGPVDQRLQRYLAARLGPIPGWTMGYGFDLEHWVEAEELETWHTTMHDLLGWPHLLGGRAGSPKGEVELSQIYDGLDYAGYTHFRPTYEDYVAALAANPHRPVFSEDRFRIREVAQHAHKDYDLDRTRRGLWDSTMAGGVANIWGRMAEGQRGGCSVAYPNRSQIQTYARFFEGRLTEDLVRDNAGTGGVCLRDPDGTCYLVYKVETAAIRVDLSGAPGSLTAVAVDTQASYKEIPIGSLAAGEQTVPLPHVSDWALAIDSVEG